MHLWLWLCPLLAFVSGSIPFGLLIGRSRGIDIREHGSGNIGATNVLRVMGKKHGIPCLLLDALKGFLPVIFALNLVQIQGKPSSLYHIPAFDSIALVLPLSQQLEGQLIPVLAALAAVLGHSYTPLAGFKGGKGVATSAGVLLALMPAGVVLLLIVWMIVFMTSRYVSLASMVAAAALPVFTHIGARVHHVSSVPDSPTLWEAGTWNKPLFFFSLVIAILVIWKHRSNIFRLRDGTENRFARRDKSISV